MFQWKRRGCAPNHRHTDSGTKVAADKVHSRWGAQLPELTFTAANDLTSDRKPEGISSARVAGSMSNFS
jgi:hypothetical protein